jgi:hypothetical protein
MEGDREGYFIWLPMIFHGKEGGGEEGLGRSKGFREKQRFFLHVCYSGDNSQFSDGRRELASFLFHCSSLSLAHRRRRQHVNIIGRPTSCGHA